MTKFNLKTTSVVFIFLLMITFSANAQQIAEPMDHNTAAVTDERIGETLGLASFDRVELNLADFLPGRTIETTLKIEGCEYGVTLFSKSLRSDGFRVRVSDGFGTPRDARASRSKTYRGYVHQMPESHIAASLIHGQLHAMIVFNPLDGVCWFMQPLSKFFPQANRSAHVVYCSWDVASGQLWSDIVLPNPDDEGFDGQEDKEENSFYSPPPGSFYMTEIAFDADWEFYKANNYSVSDTVDDVESIFNAVTLIYERDTAITWEITEIVVRTEEGVPYPTNLTHPGWLLEGFRFWWNKHHQDIHRDVAHLMTGKNLDGNVIGIGWDRAICASLIDGYGYALSRSKFHGNFDYRVTLTAHEIAHNYGISGHCDSEPECYIMCTSLGQCDGVGLPNFSPWAIDTICTFADYVDCLDTVPDDATALVEVDSNIGEDVLIVEVSPPDRNGKSNGVVPFSRNYLEGTPVTLTAPSEYLYAFLMWRFERWSLDSVLQPVGQHSLELVTEAWESKAAKAQYKLARIMSVDSTTVDGVNITLAPPDIDGLPQGNTPFEAVFFVDEQVTLEAPLTVGRHSFQYWIVNNEKQAQGLNVVVSTIPYYGLCKSIAVYDLIADKVDPQPEGNKKTPVPDPPDQG